MKPSRGDGKLSASGGATGLAKMRRASIKETGEELSQRDWQRFDAVAAQVKLEKKQHEGDLILPAPADDEMEERESLIADNGKQT